MDGQTFREENEEQALLNHVKIVSDWRFSLDTRDFRKIAHSYLNKMSKVIPQFKNNYPSEEWVFHFITRHTNDITKICQYIKSRAAVSVNEVNLCSLI